MKRMETKDWLSLVLSGVALFVSALALYFSNFHKPKSALLVLLSRSFSGQTSKYIYDDSQPSVPVAKVDVPPKTFLSYSLSNTGKQALCIKSVNVLGGESYAGNLKDGFEYLCFKMKEIPSFILKPGEMRVLEVEFETNLNSKSGTFPRYTICSLEVVSASGDRYQMSHDISHLHDATSIHHPLWDGIALGYVIRSES
jgi:hypothetical protein